MYTFVIHYADGSTLECEHIVSVTYSNHGSIATASGEAIGNAIYTPGRDLWLKSKMGSFSISGNNVRMIEVKAE